MNADAALVLAYLEVAGVADVPTIAADTGLTVDRVAASLFGPLADAIELLGHAWRLRVDWARRLAAGAIEDQQRKRDDAMAHELGLPDASARHVRAMEVRSWWAEQDYMMGRVRTARKRARKVPAAA